MSGRALVSISAAFVKHVKFANPVWVQTEKRSFANKRHPRFSEAVNHTNHKSSSGSAGPFPSSDMVGYLQKSVWKMAFWEYSPPNRVASFSHDVDQDGYTPICRAICLTAARSKLANHRYNSTPLRLKNQSQRHIIEGLLEGFEKAWACLKM